MYVFEGRYVVIMVSALVKATMGEGAKPCSVSDTRQTVGPDLFGTGQSELQGVCHITSIVSIGVRVVYQSVYI